MAKRYAVRSRYSLIAILALALTSLSFAQVRPSGPTASSPQLKGEGGLPILENYSRKDYSFGGEFWTILQDRRGVMYFGSDSVILEYDGVTWRKIFLPTDVVRSLAVDDTGRIWVGGAANFGYLAPDAAGTLQFVSLLDQVPSEQRRFTSVWQTLVTPQGIFFRSYEELFRWDGKKMQVWSPTQAKARFQALSIIRGHIYTSQEGIGLQEIVGDELRNLPGGDAYRASAKLFLYPYDDNRILISARDQLFTLYDGQKATPFPTEADEYLKKHDLYTSTVLADGGICATTLSGGAIIVGHDGKLRQIIDQGAGLLSSNVLTSYSDREGGLWLGLVNSISRVDVNSPVTILSRPAVYDVARFKDTIYTTTAGGESPVSRLTFDPKAGRLSLVPLQGAAGITQAFILQVFKDPSGKGSEQLLAATSKGVMKVEGNKLIPVEPSIFDQKEGMYFLSQSRKTPERIFLGHFDGLSSIRWDGRKWINEGRLSKTIYSVRDVAEDAHGTVWASGASGVLRVAIAPTGMGDSKVQVISEGLPEGSTDAQFLDGSVFVTVTRSKNIFRWDEAAHQFIVDNRFLLPIDAPDATSFLLPDDQGRVWSLTDSSGSHRFGVFSKQPDGTWRADEDPYRRLDRFQTFNVHFQPGGVIWLTGEHLFRYAPRSSSAAVQSFATLVRQVNSGSQVVFGGGTADAASDPRLPPGSSSMRFQFAAPTYENPEGMDYQYFLEGIDRDWSVWGKQKEANYNGLGPGKYRFHVRSRTDDGRSGEEGIYAFTILPPWYRSGLAEIAYCLLLLFLAYGSWKLISRHEREKSRRKTEALEVQARALEATVSERTEEIRAQASEISAQKESIELLSEIGKEITASLDLNTILFKLYERVNQIVDATIFGVGLYLPEKHLIEYTSQSKTASAMRLTLAAQMTRISLLSGVSIIVNRFCSMTLRRSIQNTFLFTNTPEEHSSTAAKRNLRFR